MNKEKELIKNTAIISFGKLCTQLISFFLLPLYTSVLTTGEYGTVDLVITYSSLLLPFVTLALDQALFRFLIDSRNDISKTVEYISTAFYTSSIITVFAFVVTVALRMITGNILFLYFGLVLFSLSYSNMLLQLLRGLGDNIGYSVASFLTALTQILCNILFLVFLKLGAPGMMLASFAGNIVCSIFAAIRGKIYQYLRMSSFSKKILKEMKNYSLPLIPNQLSWWALGASDKVIVQFILGVAANGIIAVATKFSTFYIGFSGVFNISWTESVALHINDKDADIFISKTINTVFRLFLSACCGIIVCMPFVFPIIVNDQYNQAYGLIPIFLLASLFNVVVSLYGVIYVAHKKTAEIAKTAIYAATLNIISHLILIKFIDIYAAAISTLIGYGGMAIYRYFHSRKYITVKFSISTIGLSSLMLAVSCTSYYYRNTFVQFLSFLMILFLCFVVNKDICYSVLTIIKVKIGKIKNVKL